MRIKVGPVVAVVAVLAAAAGLGYLALRGTAVEVVRPTRTDVSQTVVASGRVLPPAEIKIGGLVASTVREVLVDEGDAVERGQMLLRLDDAELAAALKQAKAALDQAQAGRYELAKLSSPEARANLQRAEASLAKAKNDLRRAEMLYGAGAGSRGEVEDAKTALMVAQAQHDAAQLQLKATKAGGSRSVQAAAAIARAKAEVALAEAQLARTRIESPVKGVVLARYIEPGDAVVVGSRLLQLARTGETRLVIEPDERNLALLEVGQQAFASAEAFPKQQFDATVQYIAPAVDPQRGTVEVRLHVPSPPDYLRPHMTVSVEVRVGQHEDALVVPRRAIRDLAGDEPHVLVVEDGHAARRPVRLGIVGDEQVELVEGPDAGATVIAAPDVAEGDRVRVTGSE
jgi:HlyD family secretion protein